MNSIFNHRDADWRLGRIVYQVFVDRFFSSLANKNQFYPSPKQHKPWDTLPTRGSKHPTLPHYTHELDFWGGDISGLTQKLSYLKNLGVQTLYLTPIFEAYTNHKYDTISYTTISPDFGTMDDFKALLKQTNDMNIPVILDGVFNHMSYHSSFFQDALNNPKSSYRDWFVFGDHFRYPYRSWHNVASLPELDLHNPKVREYLWKDVVQYYLRLGISGWRLDTAIELGFVYLQELHEAAKAVKEDVAIVGEINHYPKDWVKVIPGTIQLPLRDWLIQTALGSIPASLAQQQLIRYIEDTGIEAMLASWILLENHDTSRVKHDIKNEKTYTFVKWLSITLPGNLHLYQGEEFGLLGDNDPTNREPYPWHLVGTPHPIFDLHQQLIHLRATQRALRIGDFVSIPSTSLISFLRTTNVHEETRIILANPSKKPVSEWIMIPDSYLPSHRAYKDLISGSIITESWGTYLNITVPPQTVYILEPQLQPVDGYNPSKYFNND